MQLSNRYKFTSNPDGILSQAAVARIDSICYDLRHRGIAQTADFIAALYQLDEDRENGIINTRILKNRLGGKVGKVSNFKMDPETLVIEDITYNDNDYSSSSDQTIHNIVKNLPNISSDINDI